ncbi:MAG: dihydropteroate synthase [Clostridia bacterium]|nr:dihydropteroate synthase [Clostridia bacterium]NCC75093.1 dihydropteroate synthase [Clostridia bacterium]
MASDPFFQAGHYKLPLGNRTYIVGILNVTPDSFSDGGRYHSLPAAILQAEQLIASGADILDIGGESTRPGSVPVSAADEINRIIPVIEHLARTCQVPLSVDTFKADVADAALAAGASIINDVTGLLGDPAMAEVAARHEAGLILMHNPVLYRKGAPAAEAFTNMPWLDEQTAARFVGQALLVATRLFLSLGIDRALAAGIDRNRIILDPGIGFGLTTDESLELIRSLDQIQMDAAQRLPVLVGPSRKRFIGDILGKPVQERLNGTIAASVAAIACGADFVRVHDVAPVAEAVRVSDAILRRAVR